MPKGDFKMPKLQSNFIEIAFWHGCSPVNLMHIFGTPFARTSLDGCYCQKSFEKWCQIPYYPNKQRYSF